MRLFLLPISTRRTLLYCDRRFLLVPKALPSPNQRTNGEPTPDLDASKPSTEPEKPPLIDRITDRAATTWAGWEQKESGWQKQLVTYGNALLRRIPYEEWGLKSVPAFAQKTREPEHVALLKQHPVRVLFPKSFLKEEDVQRVLEKLATERTEFHRKRMTWSMIGAPLTLPFALLPVIPNIPGFYLLFRAWSHYRALYGSYHLQFLLKHKFWQASPDAQLDKLYITGAVDKLSPNDVEKNPVDSVKDTDKEVILLSSESGAKFANELGVSEMAVEIERAVEQVEKALKDEAEKQSQGSKKDA